jgi:hypothetical protein
MAIKAKKKPKQSDSRREWLLRALIAAVFSVVGIGAKDIYLDRLQAEDQKQAAEAANLGTLKELSTLLDESYRIFTVQDRQAQRLMRLLKRNHGSKVPGDLGYDETFYEMHERFTPDEAALQKLIRSTTMNSQRRVNLALSAWLQRSLAFLHEAQPAQQRAALAAELNMLKLHLNQWHDKYDAWIPNDPKRSLVYLADEQTHGAGFPPGLEQALKDVIAAGS